VTARHTLRDAYYLFETLLLWPGIVGHELAHLLACGLVGVDALRYPQFDPFAPDVTLVHETVESFPADFAIAVAPLPVNTLLGLAAFGAATAVTGPLAWPLYWLGACFALTAFPSIGDTETLVETAGRLSRWVRPVGYLLAVPLRWFTRIPGSAGIAGFLWTLVLLAGSRTALPVT
jgi:hypothetical protein